MAMQEFEPMVRTTNLGKSKGSRLDEAAGEEILRLVAEDNAARAGGVRSLARGLQVLTALNQSNPATIARLTELTELPKPTLIRQLKTLCAEGYVDRDVDGEGYRVTAKVRLLSQGYDQEGALQQAAKPILYDLCRHVPWPCELLQCDGEAMVVQAHNRGHAPLSIRGLEVRRMPLLHSASGDAYLAWCRPEERQHLLKRHVGPDDLALTALDGRLAAVRARGFGVHEWILLVQQLTVVSVPVLGGHGAIAVLSMICLSNAVAEDQRDHQFLPRLRDAAAAIAAAVGPDT